MNSIFLPFLLTSFYRYPLNVRFILHRCLNQGCHLALKKAKSAKFGLFWNNLPEIKWFGHLAIWPFFGLFWKLKKLVPFNACFEKIWAKPTIFSEILKFVSLVLANFLWKFSPYLAFFHIWGFGLFWNCLWPNLAF